MPETLLDKRVHQADKNLAAGSPPSNPHGSPFKILARTCPKCGEWVMTPLGEVRKVANSRKSPKCPCYARTTHANQWQRVKADDNYRTRRNQLAGRTNTRANAQTRSTLPTERLHV